MPTGRSITIIANPAAGRGRGRRTAEIAARRLRAYGLRVDLHYTTGPGDARRMAEETAAQRNRSDCLLACGGDGTVQEVADALARRKILIGDTCPALGLAPAGRCNDFARALGVAADPNRIADVLAHGCRETIDLGRVNGRYFCTVATVGADAEVSRYVDAMRMPLVGTPAYVYGALRVLARYEPHRLRIAGDFGIIDRPLFLASSANTASYGGAIPIAPGAVPTDGQLDLCIIDSVSKWKALAMVPAVLSGRHAERPEVHMIRTQRLRIECDHTVELWADGEGVGATPAVIEIVPGAVPVLVPYRSPG